MGNIVGEGFSAEIDAQVKARQAVYGSTQRTTNQLRYMNANNAWIRMSSAVDIGTERAAQVGVPSGAGSTLAKDYVLFGGTSQLNDNGLNF